MNYYERLQLLYSLNKDVTKIERSVYTFFMLLGDIGGFSGLLFSFGASILTYINYEKPHNNLV